MNDPMQAYEAALTQHRLAIGRESWITTLSSPGWQAQLLARWLLRVTAHTVTLAEQLDHRVVGVDRQAMIGEAQAIDCWLTAHRYYHPDATALLAAPLLPGAREFVLLYEDVAAGPHPQCHLAIRYEFGQLWLRIGPNVLQGCDRTFGADTRCYAAIANQVDLAAERTPIDGRHLAESLNEGSDTLAAMVNVGQRGLALYSAFLVECLRLADADLDFSSSAREIV